MEDIEEAVQRGVERGIERGMREAFKDMPKIKVSNFSLKGFILKWLILGGLFWGGSKVDFGNMLPVQRAVLQYSLEEGLVYTNEGGDYKTYKYRGGRLLENNSSNKLVNTDWGDSISKWIRDGAKGELIEKGIF